MNRVINWKKNLLFVWLSQLLTLAGFGAAMPFIPIYIREELGIVDEASRGFYVAAFYFAGMLSFSFFTPIWGIFADRYGRKLMLLRANFVSAALFPCLILAPNIYVLILIRFVVCIFSGTVNAAQTLLVTNTPKKHHGFALGTLSSSVWSGGMIGFLLGGFVVHYFGYFWAFMICGGLFFLGGVLVLLFVEENFTPITKPITNKSKKKLKLPQFPLKIWLILFMFLLMAMARRFDEPFIAMQIESINGLQNAAFNTGLISTIAALGGIISGVFVGYLCDRIAPSKLAVPAIIFASLTILVQAFAPNLIILAIFRFLTFFIAGALEPIFLMLLASVTDDKIKGEIFGFSSSSRSIGFLFASILGGVIIVNFGVKGIFVTASIVMMLLVPYTLIVFNKIKK